MQEKGYGSYLSLIRVAFPHAPPIVPFVLHRIQKPISFVHHDDDPTFTTAAAAFSFK